MKLQQGQIWKVDDVYIRIVHLERLEVKYKAVQDLAIGQGTHHHVTKKEFCRLIKKGTLVDPSREELTNDDALDPNEASS